MEVRLKANPKKYGKETMDNMLGVYLELIEIVILSYLYQNENPFMLDYHFQFTSNFKEWRFNVEVKDITMDKDLTSMYFQV